MVAFEILLFNICHHDMIFNYFHSTCFGNCHKCAETALPIALRKFINSEISHIYYGWYLYSFKTLPHISLIKFDDTTLCNYIISNILAMILSYSMMTDHFFITSSDIRYSLSIKICRCKQVISVNFFYLSTINIVSFNNKIITIMYFIHTYVLYYTGETITHTTYLFATNNCTQRKSPKTQLLLYRWRWKLK